MHPCLSVHETLADGSALPFYVVVVSHCSVQNIATTETLIVSSCKDEAILRVPFFEDQDFTIEFNRPIVTVM